MKKEVLDGTYYQLAHAAYKSDKELDKRVYVTNKQGNLYKHGRLIKLSTTNKPEWTQ